MHGRSSGRDRVLRLYQRGETGDFLGILHPQESDFANPGPLVDIQPGGLDIDKGSRQRRDRRGGGEHRRHGAVLSHLKLKRVASHLVRAAFVRYLTVR
jgi:hypothetical protein